MTRNDNTPLGYLDYNGAELFAIPNGIENTKINLLTNNEKLLSQDFSPNGKYGVEIAKGGPIRILPGNVKGGQLTKVGFEQAYELGQGLPRPFPYWRIDWNKPEIRDIFTR